MNEWLLFVLLSLTVYRATRLVVSDTFPPVLWLRDRIAGGWRPLTEAEENAPPKDTELVDGEPHRYVERWGWSPQWLADLLSCVWCASGWVAAGVVWAASTWSSVPLPVLMWGAVWGAGALLASQTWS